MTKMKRVVRENNSNSYEKNGKPSKTVPDQSMTVKEMAHKLTNGMPLSVGLKKPVYNGDTYVPDLSKMDLVEADEIRYEQAQRVKELKSNLKVQQDEQRKQKEQQQQQKQQSKGTDTNDSSTVIE